MKHLGDITKISGYTAPIVDCIIGGSPCQDLSVAGKRAGLDGERSGLFMEQIRIVKEMRKQDERNGRTDVNIRPRYMVWENVPGAFSSNKGEDFRVVLEEIAKVKDESITIPMPNNGKWTTSGCIVADGWSIAWRVLDAQFWGVPQRRRRIALVADFGGQSASEILFVSKSLSGYLDESQQEREDSSYDATRSIGADDCLGFDGYNGELTGDKQATLGVNCGMSTGRNGVLSYNIGDRYGVPAEHKDLSPTLTARCGTGGNNVPAVVQPTFTMQDREGKQGGGKGALIAEELSATLRANNAQYLFQPVKEGKPTSVVFKADDGSSSNVVPTIVGDHNNRVTDHTALVVQENKPIYAVDQGGGKSSANATEGTTPTLTCTHGGESVVCYPEVAEGIVGTLDAHYSNFPGMRGGIERTMVYGKSATRYIVRRLTPLECERLQGYPDGWTDIGEYIDSNGKKRQTSDASRYKALGNSIALPPWKWVLKRLCACYERDATMASLFDGIGGFPYLWEQLNGKGSCLWASEIEEFPMAVTKVRIGE